MSNYINNIPSSLLGYGPQRQQFQTYDGIFSGNESNPRARRVQTIQERILFLEDKYNTLLTLIDAFNTDVNVVKTLNTKSLTSKFIDTSTVDTSTETDKTLTVHSTSGTDIVMNDREIRFRGADDSNHRIIYNGGTGVDGIDIRGYKGGALGYMQNGTRKACMDWGSERIRSHKTFQAGKVTTSTGLITVNFPTAFKNIPVVLAQYYNTYGLESRVIYKWVKKYPLIVTNLEEIYTEVKSGPVNFFIRIKEVTTSGFTCRLVSQWKNTLTSQYVVSPGEVLIRNEPFVDSSGDNNYNSDTEAYYFNNGIENVTFSWQAFDPTSTNIYTT